MKMKKILIAFALFGLLLFGCTKYTSPVNKTITVANETTVISKIAVEDVGVLDNPDSENLLDEIPVEEI